MSGKIVASDSMNASSIAVRESRSTKSSLLYFFSLYTLSRNSDDSYRIICLISFQLGVLAMSKLGLMLWKFLSKSSLYSSVVMVMAFSLEDMYATEFSFSVWNTYTKLSLFMSTSG